MQCLTSFEQYRHTLPSTRGQTLCLMSIINPVWKLKPDQREGAEWDTGWHKRAKFHQIDETSSEKMTRSSCSTFWLIRLHIIMSSQNVVIVTKEEDAVSNHTIDLAGVAPCSHEESDTRIFVHARHATEAGSKVIMHGQSQRHRCRGLLVIAVSVLQTPQELGLQQLWLAFGQGQNLRWVPVHDLCCRPTLAEKSKGMLFFHAFTGCDIVTSFRF